MVIVETDFIKEFLISGGTLFSRHGEVRQAVTTTDAATKKTFSLTRCRSVALVNPLQSPDTGCIEQLGNSD